MFRNRWQTAISTFVFSTSLALYLITLEPSVSFWDCGEFIGCAAKLEVSHPPGAPLHALLGRLFVILFGGNHAAIAVNILSAVASALTVMLLYLTLVKILQKKVIRPRKDSSLIVIHGASIVGAFCFAVTDSFWFSAVEGEVYALSIFFTALTFYLALLLSESRSASSRGRLIYLIALLLGLSAGVHQLNLLVIPSVVLIAWLVNYKLNFKNVVKGALVGGGLFLLAFTLIPYLLFKFGWLTELLFVNTFGLFKWSGVFFCYALIFCGLVFAIYRAKRSKNSTYEAFLTSTLLYIIGLSVYAIVPIRASANVPLNTGNPNNIIALWNYVDRDQYGDSPLFYGTTFNAPVEKVVIGSKHYIFSKGKYSVGYSSGRVIYNPHFYTVFPRMYSTTGDHQAAYQSWASIPSNELVDSAGKSIPPSFFYNLKFLVNYQLGYMYVRYFLWNFVGRQNDIQGYGGILQGGWITGIHAIDAIREGDSKMMPSNLVNNKGRNVYFMLPLLLGVLGLVVQSVAGSRHFWPILLLFLLTGIAIALFLNQTPYQARERDYAYVGSFYAWAIWIGVGTGYIASVVSRLCKSKGMAIAVLAIILMAVPGWMLAQNFNDHSRAHRFFARQLAHDYLSACAPNAILFTYGDNDTFPLWYLQEAEGYRTDVRVVNLNYLRTGWELGQLQLAVNSSASIQLNGSNDFYQHSLSQLFPIVSGFSTPIPLDSLVRDGFDLSRNTDTSNNSVPLVLRAKSFYLPLYDSVHGTRNSTKEVSISRSYLRSWDLALLDIIAANGHRRPIYFAASVPSASTLNLTSIAVNEGLVLRLNPTDENLFGKTDIEKSYHNLIVNSSFRGGATGYMDETCRHFIHYYFDVYGQLADTLIAKRKFDTANTVLDSCRSYFGDRCLEWNDVALSFASSYHNAGNLVCGNQIIDSLIARKKHEIEYYHTIIPAMQPYVKFDLQDASMVLKKAVSLQRNTKEKIADK
ncbi:MAG TPA: DUF2723 domain-containing protein [Williamwhitmania sp.]|nr:DUF2723 domain-containing protein [Williamwhitmania sp.]